MSKNEPKKREQKRAKKEQKRAKMSFFWKP